MKWVTLLPISAVAFSVTLSPNLTGAEHAKAQSISRPAIVGVAHIALKTNDMAAARSFYSGVLGFQEPFKMDNPDGSLSLTFFKVNDRQYIEIFPTLKDPQEDRLLHVSFETADAEQLRLYLASRGVKVPHTLASRRDNNLGFNVTDPEGHDIEFVQYKPGSLHYKNFGRYLAPDRISKRMIHVGFIVKDRDAEDRFYRDILGFKETWQGGMKDDRTDWVDMRVPEGTDWLEYMLNVQNPSVRTRGVMHHLALGVPDIKAGYQAALKRQYKASEEPKVGRDGKWQFNLYDPNDTRVELMEPKPVQTPCCSPVRK